MRLGYNTWSMPTLPFDEAVPSLARLGYDRELTGFTLRRKRCGRDQRIPAMTLTTPRRAPMPCWRKPSTKRRKGRLEEG